jgi:hypothetical protein
MIHTINSATAQSQAVAVAGADIDPSLLIRLDRGDKVMVEVNGVRLYSSSPCPLVAERPWVVVSNLAPELGEPPKPQHKIVIRHPNVSHTVVLHYNNLLHLERHQPAVFQERDAKLCSDPQSGEVYPVYIILQLVSHYIPAAEVNGSFEPFDEVSARFVLGDADLRPAILAEWIETFKTFPAAGGWNNKSVYRTAIRSQVKPNVIEAFRNEDWDFINSLPLRTLIRIQSAIHWYPMFKKQGKLAEEREVFER